MIFTERQITVRKGKATIDEPVILYRGDFEVSIRFTIMESKFRFKSGVNLVDSEKASFGQLAILAPYGGNIFSEEVKCEDGTVTFTLTKKMIDQLEEVGLYSFQIRLFDYYRESRVSIPPVEFGIEVREPVASEDHDNEVNNAIVGYSIAKVVDPSKEDVPDTFDSNGQYNKTDWETGDRITEGKLNKIEDALDKINRNEKNDVAALDKRVTNNFNTLDAIKTDKSDFNTIQQRVNMLSKIDSGSTDGNVELLDIRIGENGKEYINAGEAVRAIASGEGMGVNSVDSYAISDSMMDTLSAQESLFGKHNIMYEKTFGTSYNGVNNKTRSLRIAEEPITEQGALTLRIYIPTSVLVDETNPSIDVVICKKQEANFKIKNVKNVTVNVGENAINTGMYVEKGDYVGVYSNALYGFKPYGTTQSYYATLETCPKIGDECTLSSLSGYEFAWYYEVNAGSVGEDGIRNVINDVDHIANLGKMTPHIIDDFSLYARITTDVANITRIINVPAQGDGQLSITMKVNQKGNVIVRIYKLNNSSFTMTAECTVEVHSGINNVTTPLTIHKGEYVGLASPSFVYFKETQPGEDVGHYVANDDGTYVYYNNYHLAAYHSIITASNPLIETINDLTTRVNNASNLGGIDLQPINDFNLYSNTTKDVDGTYRVVNTPSTEDGLLTINIKAATKAIINIVIFEIIDNVFVEVNRYTASVVEGVNTINTPLTILKDQYAGIEAPTATCYISGTASPGHYVVNADGTHTYYSYLNVSYYITVKTGDDTITGVINKVTADICDINNKIVELENNIITSRCNNISYLPIIGSVYSEKFLGNSLPTPPFGTWVNVGDNVINNGVEMKASSSWGTYMELHQRMNMDNDGIKWRVLLNDTTSKFRVERRTDSSRVGFSSTAEFDNGVMRIYQTHKSGTGNPTSVLVEQQVSMTLVSGREYIFTLETFAEILMFSIKDTITGENETLSYVFTNKGSLDAGRCWDYPRFYLANGNVKITQFEYFSRLPKSPKVVVLGDSITEGDTIRNLIDGGYTKRWAYLLYEALGKNVAILGTAGETSTDFQNKLPWFTKCFKEPEYVLLAHMTNDSDFETWKNNTLNIIQTVENMGATPVICMFPKRSGRDDFYASVLDWVNESNYKVIYFNRALTTNGDGLTSNSTLYTSDMLHPNVIGHKRMFEQIKIDLEEIFPLDI